MMVLLGLFVVLTSVSSVSAASTVYVNATGGNDANLGTIDSPYKTINKGISSVKENGTVQIANGKYTGGDDTGLTISKSMTITGQSQTGTVINGTGYEWTFTINHGVTVTIQNLTLTKERKGNDGAIYNQGNLNVTNCTFTNNTATNGGAIYNYFSSSNIALSGCTFTNNTAVNGGAIYNYFSSSNIALSGCTFINNTATNGNGGAIYNNGLIYDSSGCNFINNTATNEGGAIYNNGRIYTFSGCNFTNNTAVNGSAIYNAGTIDPLSDCTFTNNTATNGNGGAIYNKGTITSLSDCTFTNNTAANNGGAIYNKRDNYPCNSCTFINNTATNGNGGAIYNNYYGSTLNCTFTNNKADYGGAIYNTGTFTANNCTFTDNNATSGGGAIYNCGGNISLSGCNLTNNMANSGGAIFNNYYGNYGSTVSLDGCNLTSNTATTYGGAIFNDGSLTAKYNRFYNNISPSGNAIYHYVGPMNATLNWWGSNLNPKSITNLIVGDVNNVNTSSWLFMTVTATPSTIYNGQSSEIIVSFNNYSSDGVTYTSLPEPLEGYIPDGTPVIFSNSLGSVNPESAVTSSGNATTTFTPSCHSGTALVYVTVDGFSLSTPITVINSNIYVSNNTGSDTTGDGSQNKPYQTINKGISTVTSGGTVHIADGNYTGTDNTRLTIDKNMTIIGESQTGTLINGTGTNWIFHINSDVNVTITNLTLTNGNNTNDMGGAIYNDGNLTISGCTFKNNTADCGGAIFNDGSLTMSSSTFMDNTAQWYGGAIINGGNLTVSDSTFKNNTAINDYDASVGGAIYNYGSLIISGSTFTDNSASYGGAIDNEGNGLTISDSTFTGNNAQHEGGAIRNYDNSLKVTNSTFTDNTAQIGRAIWNYGGDANSRIIKFNRIVGNNPSEIYSEYGTVDATLNWWGSNSSPAGKISVGTKGTVLFDPWIVLTINANPTTINNSDISQLTGDLLHDSTGSYHDSALGHVPDIPITLAIPWGSFTNSGITPTITLNTTNGVATAIFYANEGAVNSLYNPVKVNATADDYTTNDTESAYITINPVAHVKITKTVNNSTPNYGDSVIFTITAHNEGPDTVTGLQVTDLIQSSSLYGLLSRGLTFISANTLYGTYNSTTEIWDIGSLLNGADAVLNITCNVTGTGTIVNWANVTAQTTSDLLSWSKDNSTLTVPKASNVSVITEFRDLPWGNVITKAYYKDKIYVIIKVNNNGPDLTSLNVLNSLTGITWTGTYYVISNIGSIPNIQSNWIVNDTTNTFNGTNWNIPSLSSSLGGTAKWLAIEGIINQAGTLSNHAETATQSTYPYGGYNSDTAYLTADPAPTNIKAGNATGVNGQTVNLNATLTNANGNPLTGKTITFTVNGKNYNKTTDESGIATLSYTISETKGIYTIKSSFAGDNNYALSSSTGNLTVNPTANLYIKTTTSNSNPTTGETFILTYKLGNYGPDEARNVTITFQLPEGLDFVNIRVDNGKYTYNEATRTVTWILDSVPVGDPYLYLTVKAVGDGTYKITPSTTSATYNLNSGDSGIIIINIQPNSNNSGNGNGTNTVNAASKTTIGLQKTGLPLNYLILAIIMVLCGLVPKRK